MRAVIVVVFALFIGGWLWRDARAQQMHPARRLRTGRRRGDVLPRHRWHRPTVPRCGRTGAADFVWAV